MKELQSWVNYFVEKRKQQKRYIIYTVIFAFMVFFAVVAALVMPADSMTGKLICEKEAHSHADECYELICTEGQGSTQRIDIIEFVDEIDKEDFVTTEQIVTEPHEHTEECYRLVCSVVEHEHSEECYKEENIFDFGFFSVDSNSEAFTSPQTSIPAGAVNIENHLITGDSIGGDFTGLYIVNSNYETSKDIPEITGDESGTLQLKATYNIIGNDKSLLTTAQPYVYYLFPEGVVALEEKFGENCVVKENGMVSGYYSLANVEIDGVKRVLMVIKFTEEYLTKNINDSEYVKGNITFDSKVTRDNTDDGDRTLNFNSTISTTINFSDRKVSMNKSGKLVTEAGNPHIIWTVTINDPSPETVIQGGTLADTMLSNATSMTFTPSSAVTYDTVNQKFIFNEEHETITIEYKTPVSVDDIQSKTYTNTATLTPAVGDTLSKTAQITVNPLDTWINKTGTPHYEIGQPLSYKIDWTIEVAETIYKTALAGYKINDTAFKSGMTISIVDASNTAITDYTVSDGVLTLGSSVSASQIFIKYQGDADRTSEKTSNTASVVYPSGLNGKSDTEEITYNPNVNIAKTGTPDYQTGEQTMNNKIDWKIELVEASGSNTALAGYKINDDAFISGMTISVTDGNDTAITDYTVSDGVLTLGSSISASKVIVKYQSDVDRTAEKTLNTASFVYPNGLNGESDTEEVAYNPKVIVEKSGTPDYMTAPNVVDAKIDWFITIKGENNAKIPLANYEIQDVMFKPDMQITVIDADTQTEFTDFTITEGVLTFNSNVTATNVEIKYQSDAVYSKTDGWGNNVNKATVINPNGVEDNATGDKSVLYEPFWRLIKQGNVKVKEGVTEWTIEVHSKNTSLQNYTIKDEILGTLTEEDITASNGVTFTKDGDTITITSENITYASFMYSVPFTDEQKALAENGETVIVSNTFTVANPNKSYEVTKTVTAEGKLVLKNEINKQVTNTNNQQYIDANITDEVKIKNPEWLINLSNASFGGKTLVDTMYAVKDMDSNTVVGKHYLTQEQLDSISITAKADKDSTYSDIPTSDYTVTPLLDANDNITSFEITFSENCSIDSLECTEYKMVQIRYTSTGDYTDVNEVVNICFKNVASFADKSGTAYYRVSLADPSYKPYSKYPIDMSQEINGNKTSYQITALTDKLCAIKQSELLKATIDDIEYYIFGWRINCESETFNLTDTLPDGFTFCVDNTYFPRVADAEWTYWRMYENSGSSGGYIYDETTNILQIVRHTTGYKWITYFTKIPVAVLDEKISNGETTIKNTIIDTNSAYSEESAEYIIQESYNDVIIEPKINKIYNKVNWNESSNMDIVTEGKATYTIDVNEDGAILSDGRTITVTDLFSILSYTASGQDTVYGADALDVQLEDVAVYKINSSGNRVLLEPDEYSYLVNDNISFESQEGIEPVQWNLGDIGFRNVPPGKKVIIRIKGEPNKELYPTNDWTSLKIQLCYRNEWGNFNEKKVINYTSSNPMIFDSSGIFTFEYVMPQDTNAIKIYSNIDNFKFTTADVEVVSMDEYNKQVVFELPDAQHLQIDYTYTLLNNGKKLSNYDKAVFTNMASVTTPTASIESSAGEITFSIQSSDATSSTEPIPKIKKVDVSNHSVLLSAKFKMAKYDSTSLSWQWLSAYNAKQDNANSRIVNEITSWGDTAQELVINGEFFIKGLEENTLYRLVEIQAPTGYEDASKVKNFYFTYNSTLSELPDGMSKSDVKSISIGNDITIFNNQLINISVIKNWNSSSDTTDLSNTMVEAELYWSYQKSSSGFPSNLNFATAENLNMDSLENPKQFKDLYTWENIPNGKDGQPIYYYVKESRYTLDGSEWYSLADDGYYYSPNGKGSFKASYIGNAVNTSGSSIQINNTDMLTIKKHWYDFNNKDISSDESVPESITVEIWGAETEDQIGNEVKVTSVEVKRSENWTCKVDSELLGNYQYFKVVEKGLSADYTVSKIYRNDGQTGLIEIINKNNKIESKFTDITVEKTWVDGNESLRPEKLELKLLQSTDKASWSEVNIETSPTPEINGNKWVYKFTEIPLKNDSEVDYYYKVVETVPNGYSQTSVSNNDGIQSGTIKITNTSMRNITLAKLWTALDGTEISGNNMSKTHVTVNIYRSTEQSSSSDNTINEQTGVSANIPQNAELVKENVAINRNGGLWTYTLEDALPYADNAGNVYYYYIQEVIDGNYIPIEYINNGLSLDSENLTITLKNRLMDVGIEMPSTGGSGTTIYYVSGALLILGSILFKRFIRNIRE